MSIATLLARSHNSEPQFPPSPSFLRRLGDHHDDVGRVFDKFDADSPSSTAFSSASAAPPTTLPP